MSVVQRLSDRCPPFGESVIRGFTVLPDKLLALYTHKIIHCSLHHLQYLEASDRAELESLLSQGNSCQAAVDHLMENLTELAKCKSTTGTTEPDVIGSSTSAKVWCQPHVDTMLP